MVDNNGRIRVAVLMGGVSSERDISLSTGKQIIDNLSREKYDVFGVDTARLPGAEVKYLKGSDTEIAAVAQARESLAASTQLAPLSAIQSNGADKADVALIALHGRFGEDGTIQGMLELLGLPYVGSGVLASALAMDKVMAKKVLAASGVKVPPSVDFTGHNCRWDTGSVEKAVLEMGYPVMVKPSRQGSTIGMAKVNAPEELNNAIKEALSYDEQITVEKFIKGTELTVGVLGNREPFALPVVEIVPLKGFYDYEAKYTPGATEEIVPARIGDEVTARAQDLGVESHNALGCRGMSRVDMILAGDDLYVLEINTIPGMTPTSLLPTAAAAAGIPFPRLLDMLIDYALEECAER